MPEAPSWLTEEDFKRRAKADDLPERAGTCKAFGVQKAVDEEARTIRFVMSTADIDRHHDTIAQDGWELPEDAPALWYHDHKTPAIGRWINMTTDGQLEGDLSFTRAGIDPLSDMLWNLSVAGIIKTCSVGFIPLEWSWVEDDGRPFGIDFKRQELLECSLVNVPANAAAVQLAKSKGIDVGPWVEWAEKLLDDHYETAGGVWINRSDLTALRAVAGGSGKTFSFTPENPDQPGQLTAEQQIELARANTEAGRQKAETAAEDNVRAAEIRKRQVEARLKIAGLA